MKEEEEEKAGEDPSYYEGYENSDARHGSILLGSGEGRARCSIRYTIAEPMTDGKSERGEQKKATATLVLVHGFGGCLETWDLLKRRMLSLPGASGFDYRIVSLDLPGNGFSDKPPLPAVRGDGGGFDYTFRAQGRALLAFVEEIPGILPSETGEGGGPVVLVGHSSGGVVAAAAAEAAATREQKEGRRTFGGLYLVAPGLFQSKPQVPSPADFARAYCSKAEERNQPIRSVDATIHRAFIAAARSPGTQRAVEGFFSASEPPLCDVLAGLLNDSDADCVSVRIAWADGDKINPFALERVEAMIDTTGGKKGGAKFTHKLFEGGVGHYVQHEVPDQLADDIDSFCAGLLEK